ncbi:MAG: site-specific integrase [Bacteroidetes bacterium]|nr:site-specific integrase [Bacteroidota bacterium]
MQKIQLSPVTHRGRECFLLQFGMDAELNRAVKKLARAKWSETNKCWYLPLTDECYQQLKAAVKGMALLDTAALKKYLENKKQLSNAPVSLVKEQVSVTVERLIAWQFSKENLQALDRFVEHLKLKAYSPSTIRTYRNEFIQLLRILKRKPASELTVDELKRYMLYAMEKEGINENTAHSRLNALKFYYEQVLKKEKFFWEMPRPKKPQQLPRMFSQSEITAIINKTDNLKHKVMLMLAYSAGLRVSEVVSLKTWQIDSKRRCIHVEHAKGKKDRITPLSPVLLVMLRKYAQEYKPAPRGYLFEGQTKGTPYSNRSLQEVLTAAKQKARVIRPGSIHALRHSFATHLLEKGTDISIIQKLLGHNDIKTTLRYLHATNKDILNIISPLDNLSLET